MSTTAQQIAALYGNDGSVFLRTGDDIDPGGIAMPEDREMNLSDECNDTPGRSRLLNGHIEKYVFKDGSSLVLGGHAWDFALDPHHCACFCFEGSEVHDEGCMACEQ